MLKSAVRLSLDITDEERRAARDAIKALDKFLRELWNARQQDKKLVLVLEKNKGATPESLFQIRYLLKKFQKEVKGRYVKLIFDFAGKKDEKTFQILSEGYVHALGPLEKDTITRNMKASLQDSMQQLTEFMEEFMEAFEDFNDPEQIGKISNISKKADQIVSSIENVVDNQIKPHFEKNILKRKRAEEIQMNIIKRARLINLLGE
jgi:hypothetical protein